MIQQRREQLAGIKAVDGSTKTLVSIVLCKALLIGAVGGAVAIGLAIPGVQLLNTIAEQLTGFDSLISLQTPVLAGGFVIALVVSGLSATLAATLVSRLSPLDVF